MIQTQEPFQKPTSAYSGAFSYWKTVMLAVVTLGTAGFSSYLAINSLNSGSQTNIRMLIWGIVAAVVFLVSLVLDVIFINRKKILVGVLILSGLALGIGFFGNSSQRMLVTVAAAILLVVWGGLVGRKALDDSLKLSFFRVSALTLKGGILAVTVVSGLVFYDILSLNPIGVNNPVLPQGIFDQTAAITSKIFKPILSNIDFSTSLNDIARAGLDREISQDLTLSSRLTSTEKGQMISKIVSDYQTRLTDLVGVQINPNEKLSDALYKALIDRINSLPSPTRNIVIVVIAVAFLLAVAAISPIISPVISLIAFFMYEILIAIGFGAVVYETRSKETVVMP